MIYGREDIFAYVRDCYGTEPEYLWKKELDSAVLRHNSNRKWYAIIMRVSRDKLGLDGNDKTDILNVKAEKLMLGSILSEDGFLPAYHMNKENWVTILLDGTVSKEDIIKFIDMSYILTKRSVTSGMSEEQSKGILGVEV